MRARGRRLLLGLLCYAVHTGRASSIRDAIASTYGAGGLYDCGYGTSSCTCTAIFMKDSKVSGDNYDGSIPADIGNCTNLLFL